MSLTHKRFALATIWGSSVFVAGEANACDICDARNEVLLLMLPMVVPFIASWFLCLADGNWRSHWSVRLYLLVILLPLILIALAITVWRPMVLYLFNGVYLAVSFILTTVLGGYSAYILKKRRLRWSVTLAVGSQGIILALYLLAFLSPWRVGQSPAVKLPEDVRLINLYPPLFTAKAPLGSYRVVVTDGKTATPIPRINLTMSEVQFCSGYFLRRCSPSEPKVLQGETDENGAVLFAAEGIRAHPFLRVTLPQGYEIVVRGHENYGYPQKGSFRELLPGHYEQRVEIARHEDFLLTDAGQAIENAKRTPEASKWVAQSPAKVGVEVERSKTNWIVRMTRDNPNPSRKWLDQCTLSLESWDGSYRVFPIVVARTSTYGVTGGLSCGLDGGQGFDDTFR